MHFLKVVTPMEKVFTLKSIIFALEITRENQSTICQMECLKATQFHLARGKHWFPTLSALTMAIQLNIVRLGKTILPLVDYSSKKEKFTA